MAKILNDFLYKYFGALNLQKMPKPVLTRLGGYIDKNDYPNKDVKSWVKDFIIRNPAFDPNNKDSDETKYIVNPDLPDINTFKAKATENGPEEKLSDDDIDDLYRDLYNTFQRMSLSSDDKAKEFAEKYFGNGKLFEPEPLTQQSKYQIKKFFKLVSDNNLVVYLGLGSDWLKLQKAVNDDKLDNPDIRKIISSAVQNFSSHTENNNIPADVATAFNELLQQNGAYEELFKKVSVDNTKRDTLRKHLSNDKNIFRTLYENKDKVYDIFKAYEEDKLVSDQVNKALQKTDYTGKTNQDTYIPAQYKDSQNIVQRFEKWEKETYEDVFKKFVTAHRANIKITKEADPIIKAIDKAKIKPTDDLNVLIDKSKDVANSLRGKPPFTAVKQFEWLAERLADYKTNGKSDEISGALRNGKQMKKIVTQLIEDTLQGKDNLTPKSDDILRLKTALEVLSVMQYGTFTSRTMEGVNEATKDMKLFSDGNLSWNKNDGIQTVTKVLDKTIGLGIRVAGYAATAGVNQLRRFGVSFNDSDDLQKASNKWVIQNQNNKTAEQTAITTEERKIAVAKGLKTATGIHDIAKEKTDLGHLVQQEQKRKNEWEASKEKLDKFNQIESDYKEYKKAISDSYAIENKIKTMESALSGIPYDPKNPQWQAVEAEKSKLKSTNNKVNEIWDKYQTQGTTIDVLYDNITKIPSGPAGKSMLEIAKKDENYLQGVYNQINTDRKNLEQKIKTYTDAENTIVTSNQNIAEHKQKLQTWDKDHTNLREFMKAYWNFLQSGETKGLFHWSTKNLQDKMNKKVKINGQEMTAMEAKFLEWRKAHDYAA